MSSDISEKKKSAMEFMLAEHERIQQLKTKEDVQAEQRFNFFLTITSAAIGGNIVVLQIVNLPAQNSISITQGILLFLLLFGLTNQNRLNARFIQYNIYNQELIEIQDYFAKLDPEISSYLAKQRRYIKNASYKSKLAKSILDRFRGSITDLTVFSNSLLCSGITIVTLAGIGYSSANLAIWAIITLIMSTVVLYAYNSIMRKLLSPFSF